MSKIGRIEIIYNKSGDRTESPLYHRVLVVDDLGIIETLLLTPKEMEKVRHRSKNQIEDWAKPSWLAKLPNCKSGQTPWLPLFLPSKISPNVASALAIGYRLSRHNS